MKIIELSLDFNSRIALHEQIGDQLRERLASGEFPQGTRLPTVREMAVALQVHFNTVARAYRQLEADGWLSTRPGRGTFVWRTEEQRKNTSAVSLEYLTLNYVRVCRELGYTEMDVIRELRRQMLPTPPRNTDTTQEK